MGHPTARMRNPALPYLKVAVDEVYAAMNVRYHEASRGRRNGRDFWGFLHALVKAAEGQRSRVHVPETLLAHFLNHEYPSRELRQRTGTASTAKGAHKVSECAFPDRCRVLTAGAALAEVG